MAGYGKSKIGGWHFSSVKRPKRQFFLIFDFAASLGDMRAKMSLKVNDCSNLPCEPWSQHFMSKFSTELQNKSYHSSAPFCILPYQTHTHMEDT